MSYSTTAELTLLTGSSASAVALQAIIDDADREIDAVLEPHGLSGSSSDVAIKSASLRLSTALLLQRTRMPGDNADQAIAAERARARELLSSYVRAHASSRTSVRVYQVNP